MIRNINKFWLLCLIPTLFAAMAGFHGSPASAEKADDSAWLSIKRDLFETRDVLDGTGKVSLETPVRAEDAATVPITVKLPAPFAGNVKTLTLVVDENPAPIVAVFTYGPAAGEGERIISTRIRIDRYSNVRAIAETTDGKLYMAANYVKASGGCSAPAGKDADEAKKSMGRMIVRTSVGKSADGLNQEAQIMIRHPNNSGLQMDQLTGLYTPAHYIDRIEVRTGSALVFTMEGGISISEDPNIRFTYKGNPADVMSVEAKDSNDEEFSSTSQRSPS
jgi:sulfur-oxidizing protein SoxY